MARRALPWERTAEREFEAGKTCNAHQHCIEGPSNIGLFADLPPPTGQEALSLLQEPTSAVRPAIGSRLVLLVGRAL